MRLTLLVTLVTLVTLCLAVPAFAQGVSQERFDRLAKGINLSHWFAQDYTHKYSPEHLRNYFTPRDAKLVKDAGFTFVRFTVNPVVLMNDAEPSTLRADNLAIFDDAMKMLLAHDLAVIVDMHPEGDFKKALKADDVKVDAFAAFWKAVAKHLDATTDADRVFLENLNEPDFHDSARWDAVQRRLLNAMRVGAPRHTLIAGGDKWSTIDELLKLTPYEDANIVYNIHYYDPTVFTHTGASWGWSGWKSLRQLPYPSSPEAVEQVIDRQLDEQAKGTARSYGKQRWDADRIRKDIDKAAGWAKQHNVRLICSEFGVYRAHSPADARNRYLRDVVQILESHGIGWAMWDYAGGFAVVKKAPDGTRTLDTDTAAALGLD